MQCEWPFRNHSKEQLLSELRASHGRELAHQVRVLRILEEVDRRRLFLEIGFPSLYQFCVSVLRLSEHEAYLRMTVARTARRFPVIFEMIERNEVHLTAIGKLSSHLTTDNHRSLLDAAAHKTKREVEELIAARFPKPDVTESIRRVSTSPPAPIAPAVASKPPALSAPALRVEPQRERVQPIAQDRYALRFTATARCRDLLERARELMSHRAPNADAGDIVEEALAVFVAELEKKKFHTNARPRPQPSEPSEARYIPAEVKRTVHARDGGRCTYVAADGHRCESRAFLEFDHVVPIARGGKSTADNVRLLCRAHNDLVARHEFGDEHMTLCSSGFRPVLSGGQGPEPRSAMKPTTSTFTSA